MFYHQNIRTINKKADFPIPIELSPVSVPKTTLRACLKSSNEDGNECKRKDLGRGKKFTFTIFPKPAEFVAPAEKTLHHPTARQHSKLV